jgi:hypothetical protein
VDGFATFLTAFYSDGGWCLTTGVLMVGVVAGRRLLEERLLDRAIARDRKLRNDLVGWGVVSANDGSELVRQVYRCERRLSTTAALVGGLALMLEGAGLAVAATLGRTDLVALVSLGVPRAWLPMSSLLLLQVAMAVGTGVGYPLAVRQARLSVADGPRYADLHRRRLADYRSPAFRVAGVAVIVLQCAVAATFWVVQPRWSPALVLAAMASGFVVAELLMSAIAGVRRLVVTSDPSTARRCDDLVRSQVIGQIQSYELAVLAYGCLVQGFVITGPELTNDTALRTAFVAVTILSCLLLLFLGAVVNDYRGRLGGRVTGWWNRPLPG